MTNGVEIESTTPLLPKKEESKPDGKPLDEDHQEKDDSEQDGDGIRIKGFILSLFSAMCIGLRNFTTSVQVEDLDPMFVTLLERFSNFLWVIPYFFIRGCPITKDLQALLFLVVCGTIVGVMFIVLIFSFSFITLGDATAAASMVPASTGILAWLLIDERVTCRGIIFSCLGIVGIVVISKPTVFLDLTDEYVPKGPLLLGTSLAFSSSVMRSLIQIIYRYMGQREVHACLTATVVTTVSVFPPFIACLVLSSWEIPDKRTISVSLLAGLQGVAASIFAMEALLRIKTMEHALIQLTIPLIAYTLDVVFKAAVPDWQSCFGCVIIISCSVGIILGKSKPKDEKNIDPAK